MLVVAMLSSLAQATDLEKLRTQLKTEPEYASEKPGYVLLVFGESSHLRVWIVVDEEFVYIDRNSNGDLTEEGERISVAEKHDIDTPNGLFRESRRYLLGDIPQSDAHPTYKKITLQQFRGVTDKFLAVTPDDNRRKELLSKYPHLGGQINVEIDDFKQNAGPDFLTVQENASIVHFDGPFFLSNSENHGQTQEVHVDTTNNLLDYKFRLGTPGSDPGAFAYTKSPEPPKMNAVVKSNSADDSAGEVELVFCGADYCTTVKMPGQNGNDSIAISISVTPFAGRRIEPMETTLKILAGLPSKVDDEKISNFKFRDCSAMN